MKVIIILLALFVVEISFAQEIKIDTTTKKIFFSEVIKVENTTRANLYLRVKQWLIEANESEGDLFQTDDPVSGYLVCEAYKDITVKSSTIPIKYQLWYNLRIYTSDNLISYEITDIRYKSYPDMYNNDQRYITNAEELITNENLLKKNGKPKKENQSFKEETIKVANSIIQDLRIRITGK